MRNRNRGGAFAAHPELFALLHVAGVVFYYAAYLGFILNFSGEELAPLDLQELIDFFEFHDPLILLFGLFAPVAYITAVAFVGQGGSADAPGWVRSLLRPPVSGLPVPLQLLAFAVVALKELWLIWGIVSYGEPLVPYAGDSGIPQFPVLVLIMLVLPLAYLGRLRALGDDAAEELDATNGPGDAFDDRFR